MAEPQYKLPKTVLAAFAVLCALAVYVTVKRKPNDQDPSTTLMSKSATPTSLVQGVPPDRAILKETRKEGSRFNCTVTGRVQGTMKQSTSLEAYHPIFRGDIKSTWLAPWSTRFTVEVLRNDGQTIEERRTFQEARCVELIAPVELTDLTYDLSPAVNKSIVKLAARLQLLYPSNPFSHAMGAVIKSQDFNYAEVAQLTGIDQSILKSQKVAVAGAARILDDFEGKSVEVSIQDGRAQWIYAPELPRNVVDTLGRINTLLDYSALPSPSLAIGEQTTLSNLILTEMIPPALMKEVLGDFDTDATLNLTRVNDVTSGKQTFHRFEGSGSLRLQRLDGNIHAKLSIQSAVLEIDITDPENRFVHRLEIHVPLESHILETQSRFKKVAWDGDVDLTVVYEVELEN